MTIFESTNNIIMKPSIKNILSVILLCMITGNADAQQTTGFIKAINGHFFINNKQYNFIGTNFWYGGMLGSKGEGGDRIRLLKELDLMKATGINNLRVLVGADGLDNIASKVQPALQPKAGVYNEAKANKEIVSLNAAAKDSKLELEADPKLLEGIKNEIEDEDEYYDDSYDSYEDSYYDED